MPCLTNEVKEKALLQLTSVVSASISQVSRTAGINAVITARTVVTVNQEMQLGTECFQISVL